MKTSKIKFDVKISMIIWLLLPVFLMALSSCGNSTKKDNDSELSKEVQDVKEELGEIMVNEKQELTNEIDSVITAFDYKLSTVENKIDEGNKKLNNETQAMLDNLKAERDTLNMKLDAIENQTEKTWKEFKNEVKHDSKQFAESVEDFFKDNA
jgi:ElaB/YqjD/DUF883 family membrane-anchored ribosome-binding protein